MSKIHCPKCGRVLGDTTHSIDANLNCPRCGAQHVKSVSFTDYYRDVLNFKEQKNDKSK